jgi:hypothetical protein
MSNPMKYIKDLEAVGFQRIQAEAQVQMVLEVLEGDLMTKSDFNLFKEQIDRRFLNVDKRFSDVEHRLIELELRLIVKLGLITISTTTVAVAILSWLIKVH